MTQYIGEGWAQNNLIAGYHLNGNSNDFSGNSHNGTDTSVTYSQANGKFGQGAGFGGSTRINLGSTINCFPSVFTHSLWFKTINGYSGEGYTLCRYPSAAHGTLSGISYVSAGYYSYDLFGVGGGVTRFTTVKGGLNNGVWHHFVATYTSGSLIFYVDGKYDSTNTPTGTPENPGSSTYIGWREQNNTFAANGLYLDEIQIFSVVKDANWVRKQYAWSVGKYL